MPSVKDRFVVKLVRGKLVPVPLTTGRSTALERIRDLRPCGSDWECSADFCYYRRKERRRIVDDGVLIVLYRVKIVIRWYALRLEDEEMKCGRGIKEVSVIFIVFFGALGVKEESGCVEERIARGDESGRAVYIVVFRMWEWEGVGRSGGEASAGCAIYRSLRGVRAVHCLVCRVCLIVHIVR
ncbi:hypothetical protein Tco_0871753 [Tanacetum coccineum]